MLKGGPYQVRMGLAEAVKEAAEASKLRQQNKDPGEHTRSARNEVSLHALHGRECAEAEISQHANRTQKRLPSSSSSAAKWRAVPKGEGDQPVFVHTDTGEERTEPPEEVIAAVRSAAQPDEAESSSSSPDSADDDDDDDDDSAGSSWHALWDSDTCHPYFVHTASGSWQWFVPKQLERGKAQLANGWFAATDPNTSIPYFYHPATGASRWEPPHSSAYNNEDEEHQQQQPQQPQHREGEKEEEEEEEGRFEARGRKESPPRTALPQSNWTRITDPATGYDFLFNSNTGEKHWEDEERGAREGEEKELSITNRGSVDATGYRYVDHNGKMQGPFTLEYVRTKLRHILPLEAELLVDLHNTKRTVASVLGDNELLGMLRSGRVNLQRNATATQVEQQLRTMPMEQVQQPPDAKLNAVAGRVTAAAAEDPNAALAKHMNVDDLNERLTQAKQERKRQKLSKKQLDQLKERKKQKAEEKKRREREKLLHDP